MYKIKSKRFVLIVFVLFTAFAFLANISVAKASENESEELPTPISFVNGSKIAKDSVLIESIPFELSETNSTQTYLISKGYEDLVFSFKDVSAPIKFSLETKNGDSHCAGFSRATNTVYVKTDPNSQYEFNWALGFLDADGTYKEKNLVDNSKGVLEIYKVSR